MSVWLVFAAWSAAAVVPSAKTHASRPPPAVWLTWQTDPCTTMIARWLSPRAEQRDDRLRYRLSAISGSAWQEQTGSHHPMPGTDQTIHSVTLAQLKPDTIYEFRCAGNDRSYRFRTMPLTLTRPIKLADGGDLYKRLDLLRPLCEQVGRFDPDFVILGGDIAYAHGKLSNAPRWRTLLGLFTESLVSPDGRLIPLIAVIGNHEVANGGFLRPLIDAPFFYSLFAYPGKQGYGMLAFGNYLSVVTLDSDHTHAIDGPQKTWLDRTLAACQSRPHLIVSYHVPAWPGHRARFFTTSHKVRRNWVPLFEKYHVDAVYEHHDHCYKRTFPIRDGKVDEYGVIYLGDGGGGLKEGRIAYPPGSWWTGGRWYLAKSGRVNHFHLMTIDGLTRLYQAIDMNGQIVDQLMVTDGAPIPVMNVPRPIGTGPIVMLIAVVAVIAIIVYLLMSALMRKKRPSAAPSPPATT